MRPASWLFVTAFCVAATPALAQTANGLRSTTAPEGEALTAETVQLTEEESEILQQMRRVIGEPEDPYEPLGIRAGGVIMYPALVGTIGYTTNANGVAGGQGSAFGTLSPELRLETDWARHQASLTARGSYQKYGTGADDKPEASVRGAARLDIADGWQGNLSGGYGYSQQSISDPDFPLGVDTPPGVHALDGSAGITGYAARARLTLEGGLRRTTYEDGRSGGAVVDQGDRNNTVFTARLRAGYEATPTLTPFVEAVVSRRLHDRTVDSNGLRRSSTGTGWRVGVELDRGPILEGEIAVGALRETFDDSALGSINALTVDGSLTWAPTQLATVRLSGSTLVRPTTDSASSGAVVYDGALDVNYAWRRNVMLNANGGLTHERFQGTNEQKTTYRAGVGGTWKMNRNMWLTAGYLHEWVDSSVPGASHEADTVRVELRVQR